MKARYRGLELMPGSAVYPVLEIAFNWMEEQNGPIRGVASNLLLHRLRQAGFCFCETMYGCIACKGRHNMSPRNEFEQNIPIEEEPETYEVPLKMGVGGPVIGTARVTKDGEVVGEITITDEEAKKKLMPPAYSFDLPDPADRYRVSRQQDEMDVPFGHPPTA